MPETVSGSSIVAEDSFMQQRLRFGRKSAAGRSRRCLLLATLLLSLVFVGVLLASLPNDSSALFTSQSIVDKSMWRQRIGSKNAAFCASRLTPALLPQSKSPLTSVYQLAKVVEDSKNHDLAAPAGLPVDAANRICSVFDVSVDVGNLKIPAAFQSKALHLFPSLHGRTNDERVRKLENQPIVTVRNRHTLDMTYFNEIRRFRPGAEAVLAPEDEAEITRLYTAAANAEECDFCSVDRTAEDVFGRKESRQAYTAANVAKLSRWHSLIVARQHNPLAYTFASIEEMVELSAAWFREVALRDPEYQFGNVVCDIGKRASASQVHLHFQVWMTRTQFSAGFAKLHSMAKAYEEHHGRSYWAALVEAHAAAGLVLQVGSAYVFPHLNAAKEKEIIVLEPRRTASFAKGVALAMVALRDEGRARSLSMGMALPYAPSDVEADMPALFRIIDRGNPLDLRGDTGGLEYFTSPYVGTDPYKVFSWLQRTQQAAEKKL